MPLAVGNEAESLLCAGGSTAKRFVAANGAACELRFWLQRPGP